jgi:hypothetical protein
VKTLHRLIRGRTESLSSLFIIGGVYDCQNPFFMNAVRVEYDKGKPQILLEPLKQILDSKYAYGANLTEKDIRDDTYVGIRAGYFTTSIDDVGKGLFPIPAGEQDKQGYDKNRVLSPESMIAKLKEESCKSFPKHEHPEQ